MAILKGETGGMSPGDGSCGRQSRVQGSSVDGSVEVKFKGKGQDGDSWRMHGDGNGGDSA